MQPEKNLRFAGAGLGAAFAALVALGPTAAKAGAYPEVTAQSDYYPSQTISGAVRHGLRGDEVRLPGGTWAPCGFNCYFTLRNSTVDFWRRYDVFPQ